MSTSASVSTTSSSNRGLFIRKMEEEAKANERQGIGSILGSEPERPKMAKPLRRTLSADMSSKKWLGRHGVTPLKKVPSSATFPVPSIDYDSSSSSSSSDDEQVLRRTSNKQQFDNWSSIVQSKDEEEQKKKDLEQPRLSDIWGSILTQKVEDLSKSSSVPYIHPLVKRSKSSLSQKSLEICTESLGSETGSECFSPYPLSETGDFEEKSVEKEQSFKETEELSSPAVTLVKEKEEIGAVKSTPRSFPPPLPSLSRRDGPGFLMRSHRRDGRLVLEAVPVSNYNYFHAERQAGRLLLSFINKPSEELMESDDEEEEEEEEEVENRVEADVFDEFNALEEEEESENAEEVERENSGVQIRGILTEVVKGSQPTLMVTCEVINLKNKLMGLTNKNPTWSQSQKKKKNVVLEEEEEEEVEEELTQLPQSLPCPPRVARLMPSPTAAAASFNAYDYCWRTKPTTAATAMNPLNQQLLPPPPIIDNNNDYSFNYYPNKHNNYNSYNSKIVISNSKEGLNPLEQQKQMMVLGGNEADCSVPSIRGGCKESRNRSLFIWQPTRCIATS